MSEETNTGPGYLDAAVSAELVSETDALRVQLAVERIAHAQTVVAARVAEKDALFRELRERYALGQGDAIDFASRRIVRGNGSARALPPIVGRIAEEQPPHQSGQPSGE